MRQPGTRRHGPNSIREDRRKVRAISDERLEYRDHRLDLHRYGVGWRFFIYRPGATHYLPETPTAESEGERVEVLDAADNLVLVRPGVAASEALAAVGPAVAHLIPAGSGLDFT